MGQGPSSSGWRPRLRLHPSWSPLLSPSLLLHLPGRGVDSAHCPGALGRGLGVRCWSGGSGSYSRKKGPQVRSGSEFLAHGGPGRRAALRRGHLVDLFRFCCFSKWIMVLSPGTKDSTEFSFYFHFSPQRVRSFCWQILPSRGGWGPEGSACSISPPSTVPACRPRPGVRVWLQGACSRREVPGALGDVSSSCVLITQKYTRV